MIPLHRSFFLMIMLLCAGVPALCQTAVVLTNEPELTTGPLPMLHDQHYSPEQVRTDPHLRFEPAAPLDTRNGNSYWMKLVIDNPYPNNEAYRLHLSLPLNYTLYAFDAQHNTWHSHNAGPGAASGQVDASSAPLLLPGNGHTLVYLKVSTAGLQQYGYAIQPTVILEKEIFKHIMELRTWVAWLTCVALLLCFCCYNLYVYLQLKDKVYGAYFLLQIGALIYITAFRRFFSLLPFAWYHVRLQPDGGMSCYDLNAFLLHLGGLIVMEATMQLCRFYLDTPRQLPAYDKLLKWLSAAYAIYALVPALLTFSRVFYLDGYTLFCENIFVIVIIATVMYTSMIAWRRHIQAGRHFLLANALPFVLAASVAGYFLVHTSPVYADVDAFLPEIAILSQVVTFGVALLARMRGMQEQLRRREAEMDQLTEVAAQTAYNHMLLEQEHQMIRSVLKKERKQ